MTIMIVRKDIGRNIGKKNVFGHRGNVTLPKKITTMEQFAEWIQSKYGEGRYSIVSKAKERNCFYRIFLGTIKNNKAIGSGKIKLMIK